MIYLDSASSYPILPEVKESLSKSFRTHYANSSSSHSLGLQEAEVIKNLKETLAEMIGAYATEIIITSGATESNNFALKSLDIDNPKKHIITSSIEHKCVLNISEYLQNIGFEITYVKPNSEGVITSNSVENEIREDTAIISIMHVNNELGTVNDIQKIGDLCYQNDILFHTDAAQSLGKLPIDVDELNIDMMSFSAHKIGGPKGIGAVYVRDLKLKNISPVIHGAGQEYGLRGGTVATPLVSGFNDALLGFNRYYDMQEFERLKDIMCRKLEENGVLFQINGCNTLAHIISLSLSNVNVILFLQKYSDSICVSQGSACSSRNIEPSHVLTAIGISNEVANNTLRIGLHSQISDIDITYFVEAIIDCKL